MISINKTEAKILHYVLNKFKNNQGVIEIKRKEIVEIYGISKSVLSCTINNLYLLENKINNSNKGTKNDKK
ncbi:hypothetical protein [Campylobacter ureolyticus]|uniref:Uncharacterized protein n=1 Tax=Campylobacter ureolyticus TaxID=827 RepID=A0A9Q4KME2_9BACT|nr:hypothetical protein [Campylobacter ureolyticus]MCZ6104722.1 hypothetical protein [Campylobacter ureolyticus]MCZ6135291.1 hypothetical protein [Campylobacter ureolyticus]MCZ6156988.1 hypothetical protein [Campylobacter ureolyticus]MCZ6157336.1 hypothetical protein [Campylobacter ureolyticus]MCZ6159334.1 hypothetical protein [Campylobacter ureolyticus]